MIIPEPYCAQGCIDGTDRCNRECANLMYEQSMIDAMSQLEMARLWRYAPSGHKYFVSGTSINDYFQSKFKGFTPAISKRLG